MLSTTTNHSQKDDANGWLLKQKKYFFWDSTLVKMNKFPHYYTMAFQIFLMPEEVHKI